MYRSTFIYKWLTRRHSDQKKKFLSISKLVEHYSNGSSLKILDIPCGCGDLAYFLPKCINYEGWDLNHKFLKKFKKDYSNGKIKFKSFILKRKNIFDFTDYPKNIDIIILCDILHHIYPKHLELIENVKKLADKIIICEPLSFKPKNIKAHDKLINVFIFLAKFFPNPLLKLVDFLFIENDGINSYDERSNWNFNENSLIEFYMKIGIEKKKIYNMINEYIGVWKA